MSEGPFSHDAAQMGIWKGNKYKYGQWRCFNLYTVVRGDTASDLNVILAEQTYLTPTDTRVTSQVLSKSSSETLYSICIYLYVFIRPFKNQVPGDLTVSRLQLLIKLRGYHSA